MCHVCVCKSGYQGIENYIDHFVQDYSIYSVSVMVTCSLAVSQYGLLVIDDNNNMYIDITLRSFWWVKYRNPTVKIVLATQNSKALSME